ncbi:uncharacterized protein LOC143428872 [Xylocopa sonorina]|uniref:uncharacterized protein LOC143428872 n=1 Tax=Xylocopa sonorina TaxID=1818115 RepID=UPI00403AB053
MSRSNERVSRRWSSPEASRRNDSTSTEESSSSPTDSTEYSPRLRNASTPLRTRWSDLEQINRSRRGQGKVVDPEEAFSDEKRSQRLQKRKEHIGREKCENDRERVVEKQKGRCNQRHKRGRRGGHSGDSEDDEEQQSTLSSGSFGENYGESEMERSKKRKRSYRGRKTNELPITEILKRSEENTRTKYEDQSPFPVLTTDKIYVQHRGGFSAMRLSQRKDFRDNGKKGSVGNIEERNYPPIRIAIAIQQFWRNIGFVFEGLLGGMAFMHFIMACLHVFFNTTSDFVLKYSTLCEIYTNIFSFLLTVCIISTFDKFDLARFDVEHLRELYLDYNRAVIAVPLYLIVFCLHQVSAGADYRLGLIHYSSNDSILENVTNVQSLVDDLSSWQKITMSKDLLAVFAWLFVSLGTKNDSFLMYLQSMEKYANDVESSRS